LALTGLTYTSNIDYTHDKTGLLYKKQWLG